MRNPIFFFAVAVLFLWSFPSFGVKRTYLKSCTSFATYDGVVCGEKASTCIGKAQEDCTANGGAAILAYIQRNPQSSYACDKGTPTNLQVTRCYNCGKTAAGKWCCNDIDYELTCNANQLRGLFEENQNSESEKDPAPADNKQISSPHKIHAPSETRNH